MGAAGCSLNGEGLKVPALYEKSEGTINPLQPLGLIEEEAICDRVCVFINNQSAVLVNVR